MAMVALGLACAHAARGDGGRGNVTTFSGKAGSASSQVVTFTSAAGGGRSSILTTKGDVVAPTSSGRSSSSGDQVANVDRAALTARRNAAAAGVSVPGGAVAGRPGKSGKPSSLTLTAKNAPAIEVRKVAVMSDGSEVVEPQRVALATANTDAALDNELKKLNNTPTRNAFALPGAGGASSKSRPSR
jgi:hypothetical protein